MLWDGTLTTDEQYWYLTNELSKECLNSSTNINTAKTYLAHETTYADEHAQQRGGEIQQ